MERSSKGKRFDLTTYLAEVLNKVIHVFKMSIFMNLGPLEFGKCDKRPFSSQRIG